MNPRFRRKKEVCEVRSVKDLRSVFEPSKQIVNNPQTEQGDKDVFKSFQLNKDSIHENSSQRDPKTTKISQHVKEESSDEDGDHPKLKDAQRKLSKMADRLRSFSLDLDVTVDDEFSSVEKDLLSINKYLDDMWDGFAVSTPEKEEMDKQTQIENLRKEMEEMK